MNNVPGQPVHIWEYVEQRSQIGCSHAVRKRHSRIHRSQIYALGSSKSEVQIQLGVVPCYALTVHKTQALSIKHVATLASI